MGFGKLWNYNLQYFDFLHDPSMSESEKQSLIEDFSSKLVSGEIAAEPYPVSLRLINWILYYSGTGYSSQNFNRALRLQAGYLEKNLEFHILANHLLENYIALFVSAYALRDDRLLETATKGLSAELNEQVLNDGGHYECTPMYHSIILSRLLLLFDIVQNNKWTSHDFSFLKNHAVSMLGWLRAFCWRNGQWAAVNDAVKGISPSPDEIFDTARKLALDSGSGVLADCGYRKMQNEKWEILADVGNIIPSYQPGHAHADTLSFCVNYMNKALLVDTAISTYQSDEKRERERATSAHNTVSVAASNSSEVWGSFRIARRANAKILVDKDFELVAEHDGYKKRFGIVHRRSFALRPDSITITDEMMTGKNISTAASHVAYLHFDAETNVTKVNDSRFTTTEGLVMEIEGAGDIVLEDYEQAVAFNIRKTATRLRIQFMNKLITKIRN